MNLGRVIGTVVCTRTIDGIDGIKLMAVVPINHRCEQTGTPFVAVDTVMSGPGDTIYYVSSREASMALDETFVPVDAAIIGIVDEICVDEPSSPSEGTA